MGAKAEAETKAAAESKEEPVEDEEDKVFDDARLETVLLKS